MNVFSARVWVPKGRPLSLFEQDGAKENIFCTAQIRNVLSIARLGYIALGNLCLILLLCSGFLSSSHQVGTGKEFALQSALCWIPRLHFIFAEIFRVTTQVDRSLAGANGASCASSFLPLI